MRSCYGYVPKCLIFLGICKKTVVTLEIQNTECYIDDQREGAFQWVERLFALVFFRRQNYEEKENDIESLSKGYIYLGILILHFTVKCFLAFVAIFDANGLQVTSQSILENSKISSFIISE